jgi:transcriptional regulator of acetoin/glycerol metabolism
VDPRDAATVNGAFKQFVDEFEFPVTGFDIFTVATVVEAGLVRRVLWEFGGHMSEAARFMGINRTTLYEKCRKLGINSRDFRRQRVAASAPRISSE